MREKRGKAGILPTKKECELKLLKKRKIERREALQFTKRGNLGS